jgi:F-type H+-transporting ATPase subunit delta
MISSKAAKRYAKALLTLSQEQDSLEEVLKDIKTIHDTIKGSRDLQVMLKSPIVKPSDKTIILGEIFSKRIGTLAMQFLLLVAEKERSALLPLITEAFFSLYNEAVGIIEVTLKSAYSLEVVPSLLGGITIQMEDTVIDGSVLHKLNELEHTLLSQ